MSHGLPENYRVASAKLKTESLANPHIVLYNTSSFKGKLLVKTQCIKNKIFLDDHEVEVKENGHSNGHQNGHSNGKSNGHTNGNSCHGNWKSFGDHKIRYLFFSSFKTNDDMLCQQSDGISHFSRK